MSAIVNNISAVLIFIVPFLDRIIPNKAAIPVNMKVNVSKSNITLLTSDERQTKDINEI